MRATLFAAVAATAFAVTAQAQDFDLAAGEKVFRKCGACHDVGPGAKAKVGPALNGVVGRAWGADENFAKRYSKGREGTLLQMAADDGRIWDYATLDAYLTKPKDVIPKGKMAFAGLRKEAERINVIAYLAQFDVDGETVDAAPVLEAARNAATE